MTVGARRAGVVVFSGMLAGDAGYAGATWALLQYVLGGLRLGLDVFVVEPVDPPLSDDVAGYFAGVTQRFGLEQRAVMVDRSGRLVIGDESVMARVAGADVLVNVAGMLRDDRVFASAQRRIYLDLDPAFVQCWHSQGIDMRFDGHHAYATVGQLIGRGSVAPTCGLPWQHTLPPVVLERWPVVGDPPTRGFTTVANWRSYGSGECAGRQMGQKAHSARQLMTIPHRLGETVELALAIDPREQRDLAALRENGWTVVDPTRVCATPDTYQEFVHSSRAEIGIAKQGYATTDSGWFSDRSACYLASGRPVIAQDTGFSRFLPTGTGLLTFRTADEFVAAAQELDDYGRHQRAARALAEEHLDSDVVLPALIAMAG